MRKLLTLAVVAALAAACGGGDDDDDASAGTRAPEESTMPESPATTTVDAVEAWCALSWADVRAEFASPSTDATSLDRMLEVAREGAELDNPTIAGASADIIDSLTWGQETIADPSAPSGEALPPPPDPQLFSDAILNIGFECDPL